MNRESFWSRRRAAVAAEEAAEAHAEAEAEASAERAALAEKSDAEVLEELGLPDPDGIVSGDDVRAFMARAVPEHLRRRALRKLWTSNPALACLDGLVDYADDYTDAATVKPDLRTAYRVGKGMLEHVERLARDEAAAPESALAEPGPAAEPVAVADPVAEPAPEMPADRAAPVREEDAGDSVAPVPRRMAFQFDGGER